MIRNRTRGKTCLFSLTVVLAALLGTVMGATLEESGKPAGEPAKKIACVGSRLELFVDDSLFSSMTGRASLQLHHPVRREIVFKTDAPWEGNAAAYQSVFQDGRLYRMYYRGIHYRHSGQPAQALEDHPWFLCYAESDDGIHWRRPELGLFDFKGSKANNIVLTPELLAPVGGDPPTARPSKTPIRTVRPMSATRPSSWARNRFRGCTR